MMFASLRNQFHRSEGFTLVELLIVMVLIGILASLISGSFIGATIKARDSKRKADMSQLQRALEAYYNDYNKYPDSSSGQISIGGTPLTWGDPFQDGNGTIYMAQTPNDAKFPTIQFYYVSRSDQKAYQIFTHLENSLDSQLLSSPPPSAGNVCGTSACNYGVSSSNIKVTDTLP